MIVYITPFNLKPKTIFSLLINNMFSVDIYFHLCDLIIPMVVLLVLRYKKKNKAQKCNVVLIKTFIFYLLFSIRTIYLKNENCAFIFLFKKLKILIIIYNIMFS